MFTTRFVLLATLACGLLPPLSAQTASRTQHYRSLVESSVRSFMAEGRTPGLVVGVITPKARESFGFGVISKSDPGTPDARTLYEIGSITKVFTALVLADLVLEKRLSLGDPVTKHLPKGSTLPVTRNGPITLLDLATHTSGLPRGMPIRSVSSFRNPFVDQDTAFMLEFLKKEAARKQPLDPAYAYSNLGFGLLGTVLSRATKQTYEALVRERICAPLGLKNTRITLDAALKAHLAPGHTFAGKGDLRPAGNWDFDAMAGCGALRSDVEDMLSFAAANLGLTKTPLTKTLAFAQEPRRKRPGGSGSVGLGWHLDSLPRGVQAVWHNGMTGGYAAFLGLVKSRKVGVVILSNCAFRLNPVGFGLLGRLARAAPRER